MPATFIPDTVDGSEFDVQVGDPSKTRGGLVTGISGDPSTGIDQVLEAIAAQGYYLGKTATLGTQTVYLTRAVGRAVGSDSFRVQLVFDSNAGSTHTAYVISNRSYLQSYQSNRLPGTRIPLTVPAWTDPKQTDPTKAYSVKSDNAMATFQYPMREITVSGVKFGAPPGNDTYGSAIGSANQETFLGLPPGYWVVSNGGSTDSKYAGYYSYTLSAMTKNIEDWSEIFTLFNQKLNIYVKVGQAVETRVRGKAYAYGIIDSGPGLLRVGPYPTISFNAIFGFTSLTIQSTGQYLGGNGTSGNFV